MATRLPTNQEDREVYLREHNAARYVEMIGDARAKSVDYVLMTIGAFAGEPDVLYVALDYAYHAGMTITMAPPAGRDEPRS
jgi:hypothetical protein